MFEVSLDVQQDADLTFFIECIVFTWDYHSSISFWSGLRVQPILSDEVQTFKALITVHKVLQEGHPIVGSIDRCAPSSVLIFFSRRLKKPMAKHHGLKHARALQEPTANEVRDSSKVFASTAYFSKVMAL